MRSLWGPEHILQPGPFWASHQRTNGRRDENCSAPASSVVTARIRHDHRNKGLLWFSSFEVDFDGTYTVPAAAEGQDAKATFFFDLPHGINRLDSATVTVGGVERPVRQQELAKQRISVPVDRSREATVRIRFTTRGQDAWVYSPGAAVTVTEEDDGIRMVSSGRWDQVHSASVSSASNPLSELSNFSLTVTTDFPDIDYPKGTCSPNEPAEKTNGGMKASWAFANSITNQAMGVVMPKRPNAGPIAARMSLFAPVSLFFFFTVLFTVVILKKIPLHPMHYLFVAAGFFAFHILLAYLVDKMPLQAAFWICAAVATALVVSYMRLVAGVRFAVLTVGAAELVYLVGFSYAFFYPGYTGLMIVIVAIITLFVLMQATGRVNWFQAFRGKAVPAPAAPPIPPAAASACGAPAPKGDSDGPVQL